MSGRRNAIDMIFKDGGTVTGMSLSFSTWSCSSSTPNILGMLGPVMSTSMMPTSFPCIARVAARLEDTVLLPTPPLPLMTMMMCLMWPRASWSLVSSWMLSSVRSGPAILLPDGGV